MAINTASGVPPRLRDRRERQLIEATIDCISSRGLSEVTVQAVAAKAAMAVGSINQYFNSKSRLLTAVLEMLSNEFEAQWRSALGACGSDPAQRLAAFVSCYFHPTVCSRKRIAVWFAFWGEARAQPQYRRVCAKFDEAHDHALRSLCADLIARGEYDLDAATAAKLIASSCQGLWLEMLTGQDRLGRSEIADIAQVVLTALFPRHAAELAFGPFPDAKRKRTGPG